MAEENLQISDRDDRKFCIWLVITGAAVTVCALPFSALDSAVNDFFETLGAVSLESLVRFVTEVGSGVALGAIALLAFTLMRNRRAGTRVALSLLLATIVVSILKNIITRYRPGESGSDTPNSFPSGHTTSAFAVAGSLFLYLRLRGIPLLVVAGAIGFSRLFRGSHYLSDVVAGLGIGLMCVGASGLIVRKTLGFTRLLPLRIGTGFLAFGFAAFPWMKDKFTLQQLVMIIMPPIAFYGFWSYLPAITGWAKNRLSGVGDRRLLLSVFIKSDLERV